MEPGEALAIALSATGGAATVGLAAAGVLHREVRALERRLIKLEHDLVTLSPVCDYLKAAAQDEIGRTFGRRRK